MFLHNLATDNWFWREFLTKGKLFESFFFLLPNWKLRKLVVVEAKSYEPQELFITTFPAMYMNVLSSTTKWN